MFYHISEKFKLYLSIIVFTLITSSAFAYIPPDVDIDVSGVSGGFVELVPYNGTVKSNYLEINELGLQFSIHNINNNQLASQGTGKVYVTSGNTAYVDVYGSGFCSSIQNQMLSSITYNSSNSTLNFQCESGGIYTMYPTELKGLLTLVERNTYNAAQEITINNPLTVNSENYTIEGYCNNGNEAYVTVTYNGTSKEIPVGEGIYSNFINEPAILKNMSLDQSTGNITLTFTNGDSQIITESYLNEVFAVGGESASIYTGITYPINDNYQLYVDKSGDVCVIYTQSETYPVNYALAFNLSKVYGSFTLELSSYLINAMMQSYIEGNIFLGRANYQEISFPFYSPSTDTLLYPINADGYMGIGFSVLNNEENYMYYTKSNIYNAAEQIPITENFIVSIQAYDGNTQQIIDVYQGQMLTYMQTYNTILAFGCLKNGEYLAYPYPNTNLVITNLTSEENTVGIYSNICSVGSTAGGEFPYQDRINVPVYLSSKPVANSWAPQVFGPWFYAYDNIMSYASAAAGGNSPFCVFPWMFANQEAEEETTSSTLNSNSQQYRTIDGYFGFPPVLPLPTNKSDLESYSKSSYTNNEFIGSLFSSDSINAFVILNETVLWVSNNGIWTVIGSTSDWGNTNIASITSGNVDEAELTITTSSGEKYTYNGQWSNSNTLSGSWSLLTPVQAQLSPVQPSNSSLAVNSLQNIPPTLVYQTGAGNSLVAGNNYAQNYNQPFSTVNYAFNVPNSDRQIIILNNGTIVYHSAQPVQPAWIQDDTDSGTTEMTQTGTTGGNDSKSYLLSGMSAGDKIISITPSTLKNGNKIIYILAQSSSGNYYLIISSWFETTSFSSTKIQLNITDPPEISFNGYIVTLENNLAKSGYNITANSTGFTAIPINLEALNISKYKMVPEISTTPFDLITNSSGMQITNLAGNYQAPWTLGYSDRQAQSGQTSTFIVPPNLNGNYAGYTLDNVDAATWITSIQPGTTLKISDGSLTNVLSQNISKGDLYVSYDISEFNGQEITVQVFSNVYYIEGGLYQVHNWYNASGKSISNYTIVTQSNWNQLIQSGNLQLNITFGNTNYFPILNAEFPTIFDVPTFSDTEIILTANSDSGLNIVVDSYTDSYLNAVSTLYSIDNGDYSDTTCAIFGTSVFQFPTEADQLSIENGGVAWYNGNDYASLNFYLPQYYVPASISLLDYTPTANQNTFTVPNGLNNSNEYMTFGSSNNYFVTLPSGSKLIANNEGTLIWYNEGTNSPVYFSSGGLYYESNSPMPMIGGNIGDDYTIVTKNNWNSLLGITAQYEGNYVTLGSQTFALNFPESMSSNQQPEKEYYTENGVTFALVYLYNGTTYSPWTYCFFENNGTYNSAVIILKPFNNIIIKNGIISYLNQAGLTETILQAGSNNSMLLPITTSSTTGDSDVTN